MSSSKGGSSSGKTKDYYGSVGGVVCAGPVDELVSVIVDGATLWPTRKAWADDVIAVGVWFWTRTANYVLIEFITPHRLKPGDKFQLTGSGGIDGTYTVPQPTSTISASVTYVTDLRIRFANAGVNTTVAQHGTMTKVDHYALNILVRYGNSIFKCILAHDGTTDKVPPNATYWVVYSVLRSLSTNPFIFTIPTLGTANFYWGTAGQVLDGGSVLGEKGHPPYRNQAWIELIDVLFGTERQGPPNIEVVVRRTPAQTLITGASAANDGDFQSNPMASQVALAVDPIFGLGLAATRHDATTFQAVADALYAQSIRTYISPMLDRPISYRAFIAQLLSYFDGWQRFNGPTIEAGRFLHNEAPPVFTAGTTIDFHDAIQEIAWDASAWSDTFNEAVVKFSDMLRAYKDAGQMSVSTYNRRVTSEPRRATVDRPWIQRQQQASDHAAEWAKIYAQPQVKGTLVVRAEKAAFGPGDLFLLTNDALQFSVICRTTEKRLAKPPVGQVTLRYESERGLAPIPYQPTSPNPGPTTFSKAECIHYWQFVQPPSALAVSYDFPLFVFGAKVSESTRGFRLWMKVDDSSDFYQLGEQKGFAVPAYLTQNYSASATTDDDTTEDLRVLFPDSIPQSEIDRVLVSQTVDAINDSALQVWLFNAATPTLFEICTVKAIRLDSGVYKLKVLRGQFATEQLNFSTNDTAWLVFRSDLQVFSHQKFSTFVPGGTAGTFRLQSFNTAEEADLADSGQCPDISFTFDDIHLPTVNWDKIQDNHSGSFAATASYASFFAIATKFKVWVTAFASTGLIKQGQLVGELGTAQTILYTSSNPNGFAIGASTPAFSFPDVGTWRLFLLVTEVSGRVTKFPFANDFLIGTGALCATPVLSITAGGYSDGPTGTTTVSCATAGATVYFGVFNPDYIPSKADIQAVAGGVTPQSFTWATTMKDFWLFDVYWATGYKGRRSLWAYAVKGGLTDSDLVRFDFWYQVPS